MGIIPLQIPGTKIPNRCVELNDPKVTMGGMTSNDLDSNLSLTKEFCTEENLKDHKTVRMIVFKLFQN